MEERYKLETQSYLRSYTDYRLSEIGRVLTENTRDSRLAPAIQQRAEVESLANNENQSAKPSDFATTPKILRNVMGNQTSYPSDGPSFQIYKRSQPIPHLQQRNRYTRYNQNIKSTTVSLEKTHERDGRWDELLPFSHLKWDGFETGV